METSVLRYARDMRYYHIQCTTYLICGEHVFNLGEWRRVIVNIFKFHYNRCISEKKKPAKQYNIVPWDFMCILMCMHINYAKGIAWVSGLPKGGGGEEKILDGIFPLFPPKRLILRLL